MTFQDFYKTYHLKLNKQQIEAVTTVDGPILLLAVPGSGKTTVLVSRLGYMIHCMGIHPSNILTLTYTVAATKDMAARYETFFGSAPAIENRPEFRTINGICSSIINYYGRRIGKNPFKLITDEKVISAILSTAFQQIQGEYATESDIKNVRKWIAYIKNRMLTAEEIQQLNEKAECNIADIYQLYVKEMRQKSQMDYDDQMSYAFTILKRFPEILSLYQEKYRYICVDEAQDTSKIQHAIIALLASKYENLFMVGDEDQSIYGFRAAYPEALLSFERQHPGAKVLLMEENFRSDASIVQAADAFIQKNQHRHEKHMKASRPALKEIRQITLGGRSAQYTYLLKTAKNCTSQTAVLYRDNESALPLIDLLERNGIPYRMRNADLTFFTHRVVQDIQNLILFAYNPSNTDLFLQIYYKISSYLNKQKALEICRLSEEKGLPVFTAAIRFARLPMMTQNTCKKLQQQFQELTKQNTRNAIQKIVQNMGYAEYLERSGMSDQKLFILRTLAKQEPDPLAFLNRLDDLRTLIKEKEQARNSPLILSTIHASKGLEYDRVLLLDIVDGIFPESVPTPTWKTSDTDEKEMETYEEERRLFYVGVTRAKEELILLDTGKDSAFLKEFLPPKPAPVDRQPKNKQQNKPQSKPRKTFREYRETFGEGMLVEHKAFGRGVIAQIDEEIIRIVFDEEVRNLHFRTCYEKNLLEEI